MTGRIVMTQLKRSTLWALAMMAAGCIDRPSFGGREEMDGGGGSTSGSPSSSGGGVQLGVGGSGASGGDFAGGGATLGSGGGGVPGVGASTSAGGIGVATGGSTGMGGQFDFGLEPTADCVHPPVVEDCDGDFCRIPAGCFIMGAPPNEFGRAAVATDQVQVRLTHSFWLGRTETTRAQWRASGLDFPSPKSDFAKPCEEDTCPVSHVTFYDALAFANLMSERSGLSSCYELQSCTGEVGVDFACTQIGVTAKDLYACAGYRLPMESEWEYAARAGTRTSFPTGNVSSAPDGGCHYDPLFESIGWYCVNSPDKAQPAARKLPNGFGLYDMHGNMLEWVNQIYSSWGYGESPQVDPLGKVTSARNLTPTKERPFRVQRGGVHNYTAAFATSAHFSYDFDSSTSSNVGFRLARTIFSATEKRER